MVLTASGVRIWSSSRPAGRRPRRRAIRRRCATSAYHAPGRAGHREQKAERLLPDPSRSISLRSQLVESTADSCRSSSAVRLDPTGAEPARAPSDERRTPFFAAMASPAPARPAKIPGVRNDARPVALAVTQVDARARTHGAPASRSGPAAWRRAGIAQGHERAEASASPRARRCRGTDVGHAEVGEIGAQPHGFAASSPKQDSTPAATDLLQQKQRPRRRAEETVAASTSSVKRKRLTTA